MDYEEELEAQYNAINKYQEKLQDEKYEISKLQYTLANLENEKYQLISFLEDKIKEIEEKIKDLNYNEIEYYDAVRIDIYQEVLDFVNKGGKE